MLKKIGLFGMSACLVLCTGCGNSSKRNYAGEFKVEYEEDDCTDSFSDVRYEFVSEDKIVLTGKYLSKPFKLNGVLIGRIDETADEVNPETNERYTTYEYEINVIEESTQEHGELKVRETDYASGNQNDSVVIRMLNKDYSDMTVERPKYSAIDLLGPIYFTIYK